MGKVADYLIVQLLKQVDQHGIVVWYDPKQEYASVLDSLETQGVTVRRYDGSFFALRREIEPFLNQEPQYDPETKRTSSPRLLVYLPIAREATHDAMIEAEKTGVVMEPGAPGSCNTRLEVVVRAALRGLPGETLEQLSKGISSGAFALADVEALAEQGGAGAVRLSSIFGPAAPHGVALRFLTEPDLDSLLESKGAVPELLTLLRATFGCEIPLSASPGEIRKRLTRHVLLGALAGEIPPGTAWGALDTLPIPSAQAHRDACRHVAEAWRDSEKLRMRYCQAAEQVQAEYRISGADAPAGILDQVLTFPFPEPILLQTAGRALRENDLDTARSLARKRLGTFWARSSPELGLRWTAVDLATRLLTEAARIETELRDPPPSPAGFIQRYAEGGSGGEAPWCVLDQIHRSFARLYGDMDPDPVIEPVARQVRARYAAVLDHQARTFTESFLAAKGNVTGVLRQSELFRSRVEPVLSHQRVAYVWVDAMRFEMAHELGQTLGAGYQVEWVPAVATLPTITLLGMAALCPGAHEGLAVTEKKGTLVLTVAGRSLRDRKDRVELVKANVGGRVVDLYLRELQKPTRSVQESVRGASLVLVTSQEIDRYAEQGEDEHARAVMEKVLLQLKRAIRNLVALGVGAIILTADHGFLFGEALAEEMMINPPGGQTLALERRVWIGRGGSASESYFQLAAADLGLAGDLEFAFPVSTAIFRGRGSRSYFHGGISLQEIVIPVMTVRAAVAAPTTGPAMGFRLSMDRLRITSRLFSVAVEFEPDLMHSCPVVRCVARAHGREVGHVVAAEYGLREGTRELELGYTVEGQPRRNVVTLMFDAEPSFPQVSVHLLDAETQAELSRLESIPVEVAL